MAYETHYERYKELKSKYKIAESRYVLVRYSERERMSPFELERAEALARENYDVVVTGAGSGYAHTKYRVLKNTPNLGSKDLAIICDRGNLCFGYRVEGPLIYVYTD